MNPPYNILHIVSTQQLSGAERIVQHIGRLLDRKIFCPVIVCAGDPLRGIYEQDDHSVETCPVAYPLPRNILKLHSIIRNRQIHLIHAHDHRASLMAWLSTRWGRQIPIVSHIHNANPWLKGWHPFKMAELFLRNRYDISIACSETVKKYFLQHNPFIEPEKIVAVTNGIEIKPYRPVNRNPLAERLGIPGESFVFGTVGRLVEQKGIDYLLLAFEEVTAHLDNVALLIVGTGPQKESLEMLARQLGVSDRVVFAGYREDVDELLQIMDCFVLPSRWEGLPMVLMEAMAHFLPVIASDVGGVSELVRHGETGFLVRCGDVEDLVQKMLFLHRERDIAKKFGTAGRALVEENFNMARQVRKIEEIYMALITQANKMRGDLTHVKETF